MEKEYINPNNPVYFSYAWDKDEQGIEEDVNNLCKLLEKNDIYYKRDKVNLCNYRWCINDSEIEIGEGSAIIVVISERYIKSLHCMNEWHLMRENGKIWERVFRLYWKMLIFWIKIHLKGTINTLNKSRNRGR